MERHLRDESQNADRQNGDQNASQRSRLLENEAEERREDEERNAAGEEKKGGNVDDVGTERHLVENSPDYHEPSLVCEEGRRKGGRDRD